MDISSGYVNSWPLKMASEMVDVRRKNGDVPELCKGLPEGKQHQIP